MTAFGRPKAVRLLGRATGPRQRFSGPGHPHKHPIPVASPTTDFSSQYGFLGGGLSVRFRPQADIRLAEEAGLVRPTLRE